MTKLSLRDLFAVVTVLALLLGWWMDHRRLKRQSYIHQAQASYFREKLEQDGYTVTVSPDGTGVGVRKAP
jgi:hypothetical protein